MQAHIISSVASRFKIVKAYIAGGPPRNVQSDQLGCATEPDTDDATQSPGVEHDAPGHLRLNGHGAVDAERRSLVFGAHGVG